MLKWFICPDSYPVEVQQCLAKCRLASRCLTTPTLSHIAEEREWHGVASTTQLLDGTMLQFLKLTKDFAIKPKSRAFALAGTYHHELLETQANKLGLPAELALSVDRNILDLLEPDIDGETLQWVLSDYKNWGSYRVVKAMGLVKTGKIPDPSGEVYKSSGAWGKAGSPKMIWQYQLDASKADNWEVEMQLNRYKLLLAARGINVSRIQCQITVRDGGLQVATERGVTENMYLIPIRILDSASVTNYFAKKEKDLLQAMESKVWTEVCNIEECWDGARCSGYCEVAIHCPKGILYMTGEMK